MPSDIIILKVTLLQIDSRNEVPGRDDIEINAAKNFASERSDIEMDTAKEAESVSEESYNTGTSEKVSEVKLFGSTSIFWYRIRYTNMQLST